MMIRRYYFVCVETKRGMRAVPCHSSEAIETAKCEMPWNAFFMMPERSIILMAAEPIEESAAVKLAKRINYVLNDDPDACYSEIEEGEGL